jgi:hypothetical protein
MRDVLRAAAHAAGVDEGDAELLAFAAEPIRGSSGVATAEIARLTGRVRVGGRELPFSMVRKTFRRQAGGERTHWAYWRRELLAYASGTVPSGPDLTAPECLAVTDDAVLLADITGPPESPAVAARRLGRWQAATPVPDVAWLGGHQLAQRIATSDLDWSAVDVPERLRRIWERREHLLAALDAVPVVVCHGDFHTGNLIAAPGVTVVLDWGTLAAGPAGADLAHLALSTGEDLLGPYLDGLDSRFDAALVARGYHVTMALTAAGRAHWMRERDLPVPASYTSLALSGSGHL